ncbi:hypothetical protein BJ322DRAFT_417052 [Thelephora terrestris]|uniref:Glutaminase n=1 Tax=Thelephora terrestris TaxID=56493 RepID=A0A9P6LBP6_9AGAM|nr:hypothetical protein BJ322DRAFT_417052 [Thelephora terrestris]
MLGTEHRLYNPKSVLMLLKTCRFSPRFMIPAPLSHKYLRSHGSIGLRIYIYLAWKGRVSRNHSVQLVRMLFFALQLLSVASFAFAQNFAVDPFIPPMAPLAVKMPYLQAWLPKGGANCSLNSGWQTFRGDSKLTWTGMLRVDGQLFIWMGDPGNTSAAVQKYMTITPTRTIITLTCGAVDLTATFLSPIEPKDLVNQSIPFSYLSVEVLSNDGNPHHVQLYTDIDGEWLVPTNLATNDQLIEWETVAGDTVNHRVSLQNQVQFLQVDGRLRDGSIIYSTKQVDGMTYQVGEGGGVRTSFLTNGTLNNTADTQFRAIDDEWPIFAFAHDLGVVVTMNTTSVVYTIGYVRDVLAQLLNIPDVNSLRGPYYITRYPDVTDMVAALLDDFPNTLARATSFDDELTSDALNIIPQDNDYSGILALSVRQVFGNIELTAGWNGTGYDPTDIMVFLDDGFTNAVDTMYAAWPAILYTNPAIGKYLLEPVLAYQANNLLPGLFPIHDLGASTYPNVTGPSSEVYPVETCGDHLIMALSYTQKTSDNSLITNYQSLYDQFATYLSQNGLYMGSQFSSDSFAGQLANQTNLAVKSIIALQAASEIFQILGDSNKSTQYGNAAASFLEQWQSIALSIDKSHYTLSYRNDPSWGLLYNLYADRLLGFNMFPQSVYDTQTKWYASNMDQFGIRLDSRSSDAKTDWQLWTAATVTDGTLRTNMIKLVSKYASSGINSKPFPDRYSSQNGQAATFEDRSVVGGHFALLLVPDLKQGFTNGSSNSTGDNGGKSGGAAVAVPPVLPMILTSFVMFIYVLS